jgi:DNA polymerase
VTSRSQIIKTIDELKHTLQYFAEKGHRGFDCSRSRIEKMADWGAALQPSSETLNEICSDLGDCQRCRLAGHRKNIVFGSGSPKAKLVFVGEGPGFEEDRQGEPFVGPAGQLLTKIIEAIKLTRKQTYICNIVKCRPPGNRNPETDEINICFSFLERQVAAIQPDYICALGAVAAQTLLSTTEPISQLRGRIHHYKGIKVIATYHPAYLLRNPEKKRDVWEDMKMLMKEYPYEI